MITHHQQRQNSLVGISRSLIGYQTNHLQDYSPQERLLWKPQSICTFWFWIYSALQLTLFLAEFICFTLLLHLLSTFKVSQESFKSKLHPWPHDIAHTQGWKTFGIGFSSCLLYYNKLFQVRQGRFSLPRNIFTTLSSW